VAKPLLGRRSNLGRDAVRRRTPPRHIGRGPRRLHAAVANYRQTVLSAFQEVEDNLAGLRVLETEAKQQNYAVLESRRSVELFTNLHQGGAEPYLQVVTAQISELANERNAIDILHRRMEASVLLVKALRGGWDASKLPPISSLR
jgi:outer membrane protein TolC